jgi:hypothetical protein
VWPSEGIYCLATPFTPPGQSKPVFAQKTFETFDEALKYVSDKQGSNDLFFNIHTLKEHRLWNPNKVDHKTGEKGANEIRSQRNTKAAKCFFFDLDVGEGDPTKYPSQEECILGVRKFCEATDLPRPMLVSSGGGVHVYWPVSEALDSDEWRDHATRLRQLAQHHGLRADPTRTTDTASLLRVVGTFNFKNRDNPRVVKTLVEASGITGTGAFTKLVSDAVIKAGMDLKSAPRLAQAESLFGSNTDMPYEGPRPAAQAVFTACAQMRRLLEARGKFSEPEWYYSAIGIGRFTENPDRFIHNLSSGHSDYDHATCEAKIEQSAQRQSGPSSCATVAFHSRAGEAPCEGCPFQGKVFGPIQAALYTDSAPAPIVIEDNGEGEPFVFEIPDPPKPFMRMKGGGVSVLAKGADGDESHQTIYQYDLDPKRRLVNPQQGIEQQVWYVELPRNEAKDFTLDADMLYDLRKFAATISNQGIYPEKGHLAHLQEYMVAYISKLQQLVDADAQCNHLGWTDEYERFIMPDKIVASDGTARSAQLSTGAQRASAQVFKKGALERQVELLRFYEHPKYVPNQFYILAGLAAPIFHMTGHHGVIVNASGDAGASKSTSLYTAASFWGQPELYPINGTNNGATVRGRNERVTVLANLPVCVDEITHMPVHDAVDLAMSITQPGHRIRLQSDGVERASLDSYKATIMLATGNNSLHGLLSTNNTAGTAGSMRVVEIKFTSNDVHAKHEADDYLDALKSNFGHVGEAFVSYVVRNREAVKRRVREVMREIDTLANIQPSERFWSATVAAILVAGEIARELGLLNYSVEAIKAWVLEHQLPEMRGVVQDEYSDPLAILADYLEQINNQMIVIDRNVNQGNVTYWAVRKPMGPLFAHYDTHKQLMHVLKKGFKDYCTKIGANSLKVLDDLAGLRDGEAIIANKNTKRVLGAGTDFAKAQAWCFTINMGHKDVSGVVDLEVLTGGGEGGEMSNKPTLHAV